MLVIQRMPSFSTYWMVLFILIAAIVAPIVENFIAIGSIIIFFECVVIIFSVIKWLAEIFTKKYKEHENPDLSNWGKVIIVTWILLAVLSLIPCISNISSYKEYYDERVEEIETSDTYKTDEFFGDKFRNDALSKARKSYEELVNPEIKWLLLTIIVLLPAVYVVLYISFYKKYEFDMRKGVQKAVE